MLKKLFLQTYGCQMNVRDSEEAIGLLLEKGYALAESKEAADVILFNTCSIREHAEDRIWSNVGILRKMKALRPELIIGVMGCMAKAQNQKIFKRMPHVDFISGPTQLYEVPELIESILESRRTANKEHENGGGCETVSTLSRVAAIQERRRGEFQTISYHTGKVSALVTIMEGCDKVCSYCVVPYTRGPEVSRPPGQVLGEVRKLAAQGFREVVLLGQNVNSYGRRFLEDRLGSSRSVVFPDLLRQVNAVPGIERIRFITSHPRDAAEDLFDAMKELPKACEHLHLPVQSGSNRVLERMRRGCTVEEYLRKLELLRARVPDAAVTTDLIVGFPGETDEDFEATVRLVQAARFDSAFIFSYSPRPFAAASRWPDSVPQEVKERRLQDLLALQQKISREEGERRIGQAVELLVEEPGMGRTRTNRKAYFPANGEKAGDLLSIRVKSVRGHSFVGEKV